MPFLYGNHIVKAHLGRITDDTPEHTGVVIYSMNDSPLVSKEKREKRDKGIYSHYINVGIRCYCQIHSRYEETSTYRHYCVPSG
jgi:hypothetical protein